MRDEMRGRQPSLISLAIRERERSVGEDGLVAQDAIEGGAADAELAGGAQLVAAVQVEHELHVMADDRIEAEVAGRLAGCGSG